MSWEESVLYQNLAKLHGEEEAEKECNRLLNGDVKTIYDIREGEMVQNYKKIIYFGFNIDKYIENIIKSRICEPKEVFTPLHI